MSFRKLTLDSVNRALGTLDGAAGKSINVAKVLKALGKRPVATGFLGGDRGVVLQELLEDRGIECEFIPVPARTRQCITVIDETCGQQTELVEESAAVKSAYYARLLRVIERRAAGCKAVIMSGTITPGGPVDFYERCTNIGSAAGALTVVDAKGPVLLQSLQARPGLVKPNRAELGATLGKKLESQPESLRAMLTLHERGAERVVVTAGKGPTLASDGRRTWRILSPRVRAVNPIGSGDAFTAALTWRLVGGDNLGEACRWAVAAGAANALSAMPGELDPEDVRRLVRSVRVEKI
jgi:tagatose 6-phosphate kinase